VGRSSELPDRPPSRVRDARKAAELRQADLGKRAGIATSYVCMIERGYIPKLEIRLAIAQVLKTKATVLWPEVKA
jgi:transcriptional regulator with XRE-family HTH domain